MFVVGRESVDPSRMWICIQMQTSNMHISRGSSSTTCKFAAVHACLSLYYACELQIPVLSSNTKKGEIESACFGLLRFCVFVDNTRMNFTVCQVCRF